MAPTPLAQSRISGRLSKPGFGSSVDEKSKKRKHEDNVLEEKDPKAADSQTPSDPSSLSHTSKRLKSSSASPIQTSLFSKPSAESATEDSKVISSDSVKLSEPLEELLSIHRHFLKAVSIYFAHHGASTSIDISELLPTITRLWKIRTVSKIDIRKVLGLYEVSTMASDPEMGRSSPFKLRVGGTVTYVDYDHSSTLSKHLSSVMDESGLQKTYSTHIRTLLQTWRAIQPPHLSFLSSTTLTLYPLASLAVGSQTISRQAQARQIWAQILKPPPSTITVKSRTTPKSSATGSRQESLLSRIRAKKLAKQADPPHSAALMLRRHALGRLEEVVNILRLMQAGKQKSKTAGVVGLVEAGSVVERGRVSFSVAQIMRVVVDSVRAPVGEEVVGECLRLLGGMGGEGKGWVCVLDMGEGEREEGGGGERKGFVVMKGGGIVGKEAVKLVKLSLETGS